MTVFEPLRHQIAQIPAWRPLGRVKMIRADLIEVTGLSHIARIGDQVVFSPGLDGSERGEIIQVGADHISVMPHGSANGIALDAPVLLDAGKFAITPCDAWLGRVVDPFGEPLDAKPLPQGSTPFPVDAVPPTAHVRQGFGKRLNTGFGVLNTFLPLVEGQRIGLFAGAGVGKSSLLGGLAKSVESDVIVVALVGERGRELRHFIEEVLGPRGMSRSVVVAATADQSALRRRRCAWAAMAVAEYFREQGKSVLLLVDSVTRFAEAHRDIALAAGELPAMRGLPASTAQMLMSLCERAGPGRDGEGNISAVFSVLVAGSDFDEPVADTLRGVLDGHLILSRDIAERGRFPAIDVLKSVSRSLPAAATEEENALLADARQYLSAYDRAEVIIQSGLYAPGSDPLTDRAVRIWPELDAFCTRRGETSVKDSFQRLNLILRRAQTSG